VLIDFWVKNGRKKSALLGEGKKKRTECDRVKRRNFRERGRKVEEFGRRGERRLE